MAAGIGVYGYKETSPSADPGEEVDTNHAGWLLLADVQYANVPGILGQAGLSRELGEANLGGIAARFKVIFGR